jgi:hypothetical protein
MSQELELELEAGGSARITLPEPGQFPSFYVLSLEFSGSAQFWNLLDRLMSAAGYPVCDFFTTLGKRGLSPREVQRAALRRLMDRPGYGFGTLFGVDPALKDLFGRENQKLLFLRNPLDVLAARYRILAEKGPLPPVLRQFGMKPGTKRPASFVEFLKSPEVERSLVRYRGLARLRREGESVAVFRAEQSLADWRPAVSDLVAILGLPIDASQAASIAAAMPPLARQLPSADLGAQAGAAANEIAELEARFADVFAAFGYAPRTAVPATARPLPAPERPAETAATRPLPNFGAIFERDPALHSRLKPNTAFEMQVLGRRILLEVDATGCRPVAGQPEAGDKTLAAYGCSCTYGNAIPAEETFCSQLQGMFPEWRVENHGVPAYSTVQSMLQFERDSRWNQPDFVTFGWIPHHIYRNVADVAWVQEKTRHIGSTAPADADLRFPCAMLNADGALEIRSVRMPRRDLLGIDFSDFAPDEYYLDLVCCRIFERINAAVKSYGGHFFVTTLLQPPSAVLGEWLREAGIPVVDACASAPKYTCLPDDGHPNGLAHRLYAERIRDYLLGYLAEAERG